LSACGRAHGVRGQAVGAEASVFEPYTGKSAFASHGQRVVEGQRSLQAASDILLGWLRAESLDGVARDYYVRQLWDWKYAFPADSVKRRDLLEYARVCARTLARGHAVSGDAVAIAAYLGRSTRFDVAIADFAAAYANQNEDDFQRVAARSA